MNTLSHVVSASPRTARVSFASILQSAILLMLVIGTSYLYGTDRPDTGNGRFLRAPKPIPGEYLVVLDRSIRAADVEPRGRALTKQFGGRLVGVATNAANLLHVELNEHQALALANAPGVLLVEENGY